MSNLMSVGRSQATEALRQTIQAQSNERQLGVNITFVGLQDIHPSGQGGRGIYEKVVSERESAAATILEAEAHGQSRPNTAGPRGLYQPAGHGPGRRGSTPSPMPQRGPRCSPISRWPSPPLPERTESMSTGLIWMCWAKSTSGAQKKIINATGNTKQIFEFNGRTKTSRFT